jgi:hypothetical protein
MLAGAQRSRAVYFLRSRKGIPCPASERPQNSAILIHDISSQLDLPVSARFRHPRSMGNN